MPFVRARMGRALTSSARGPRAVVERLESRQLLSASVVGRWIFYNNSHWDGNGAALGGADDAAIAPDKRALLPGGHGAFQNYTSYSRGLNGIMVDVQGLSGAPDASDFEF